MNYLPPVESFIHLSSSDIYNITFKENCNPALKLEDVCTKYSVAASINKSSVANFWNYNTCNKGPRKKFKPDDYDSVTRNFYYEDPIKTHKNGGDTLVRLRRSDATNPVPDIWNFIKIRNNISQLTSAYRESVDKTGKSSPKLRNVLASKICRLKKRAYHESLKIKYVALGLEHEEIRNNIVYLKQLRQSSIHVARNNIHRNRIRIIKAAGRLDEFIHELLSMVDGFDYMNPVLLKFSNFAPKDAIVLKQECFNIDTYSTVLSPQRSHPLQIDNNNDTDHDDDTELDQLFDEYSDFLNSSTSTSFTTHLMV